ncbi:hypothetical protein F4809DRAFT_596639 [Biscogniauxia mediterranea]|nr:hypothetical protein F4809DRAFT_596639 [Biscogniauxia mediterranea]
MSSLEPSVNSVRNKLDQQQGAAPANISACLQAISQLSEPERRVLLASAAKYELASADEGAFAVAALRALSSGDLDQELAEAANGAADAVKGINDLMGGLVLILVYFLPFTIQLLVEYKPVVRLYCETMRDGIPLAETIAQYADDFDNKIISLCADASLTTDERLKHIQAYIKEAQEQQTTADKMQRTLESVFDLIVDIINRLTSYSLPQQAEAKSYPVPKSAGKFATVPSDLEVPALKTALASPFGPYITVAGLLGVGNAEATSAAYAIAAHMATDERVPLETVIRDVATPEPSSTSVKDLKTDYFDAFRKHIEVLAGYWSSTLIDARQIEDWLKLGASAANIPKYMEISLNEGAKIYVKVAKYLRSYAEQTGQIPWDDLLSEACRVAKDSRAPLSRPALQSRVI